VVDTDMHKYLSSSQMVRPMISLIVRHYSYYSTWNTLLEFSSWKAMLLAYVGALDLHVCVTWLSTDNANSKLPNVMAYSILVLVNIT